jgi:flagellar export protein FliJ
MYIKKLTLLLELADADEARAFKSFEVAQAELSSAQNELSRVLSYQREYLEVSEGKKKGESLLLRLKNARLFLSQIDKLIVHQRELIKSKRASVDSSRAIWHRTRAKRQTVEKLLEAETTSKRIAREKKDQQQLDDLFLVSRLT